PAHKSDLTPPVADSSHRNRNRSAKRGECAGGSILLSGRCRHSTGVFDVLFSRRTVMSNAQVADPKTRERVPLNGVDTPKLFATLDAVRAQPELATFQFRATNHWMTGTHSRSRIETFSGAGGEHRHIGTIDFDADHPTVLVGADRAPTPVEFLLHAIAAC